MDAACVSLEGCVVTGNKGPGVDLSGEAAALLADCTVKDNCGGVFLWEDAKCSLQVTLITSTLLVQAVGFCLIHRVRASSLTRRLRLL